MIKIVYSCANRIGAGVQLTRFLRAIADKPFEVRIAGYVDPTESLTHIDWTLDALRHRYSFKNNQELIKLFGYHGLPHVGFKEMSLILEEISAYNPDIIICDAEPIVAHIAKTLGIRLWYASPLHLLDGIKWANGQMRYRSKLEKHIKVLSYLPEPEKRFIYSPFGEVGNIELKPGFKWMKPYHIKGDGLKSGGVAIVKDAERVSILSKILNCIPPFDLTLFSRYKYNLSHLKSINMTNEENREVYRNIVSCASWVFTTGETCFVSDAIYNGAKVCVAPRLDDPESLLNAIMVKNHGFGDDLAQVEHLESYAVGAIKKSYSSWATTSYTLNNSVDVQLHTELEKLCM